MSSCKSSKLLEIDNTNKIWSDNELIELNSIISEFENVLMIEYKTQSEKEAYKQFSKFVVTNGFYPEIENYEDLFSKVKDFEVFHKIWQLQIVSKTQKNHFKLKYNSSYQEYLESFGEKSEFIRMYADKFEYTGGISPSENAYILQNIDSIDLNNKNIRLILAIHNITLINRY